MWKCKKCGSSNIVCNQKQTNFDAGNELYQNKKFGKINVIIDLCWCSECGTLYNNDVFIKNNLKEDEK